MLFQIKEDELVNIAHIVRATYVTGSHSRSDFTDIIFSDGEQRQYPGNRLNDLRSAHAEDNRPWDPVNRA